MVGRDARNDESSPYRITPPSTEANLGERSGEVMIFGDKRLGRGDAHEDMAIPWYWARCQRWQRSPYRITPTSTEAHLGECMRCSLRPGNP